MTDAEWYVTFLAAIALLVLLAMGAAFDLVIDGWVARGLRRPVRYLTATGVAERSSHVTAWLWLPVLAYVSGGVLTVGVDLVLADARGAGTPRGLIDDMGNTSTPFAAPFRGVWVLAGGVLLIEAVALLVARRQSSGRGGPWRHVESWGVLRETLRHADDADVLSREWRTEALVTRRHLKSSGGRGVRRQRRALALLHGLRDPRVVDHRQERHGSLVGLTWATVPWSAVARWSLRRARSLLTIGVQCLLAASALYSAVELRDDDGAALRLLWPVLALVVGLGAHASWLRLDVLLQARAGVRREALERDVDLLLEASARRARVGSAQEARVLLRIGRFTVLSRPVSASLTSAGGRPEASGSVTVRASAQVGER